MDRMTLLKLLLVTFPENICSIYAVFLLTGDRLNLPFRDDINNRKNNITKLFTCVVIFSLLQYFGRRMAQDMGVYFVLNIIISIIVLRIIYGHSPAINREKNFIHNVMNILTEFKKPFIQVIIMFGSLYLIESIFIPPIMQALNIQSIKELYSISWINLVFPQIDRFIQILAIAILWNHQRLSQNFGQYNCKKISFMLPIVYFLISEFVIIYLYINSFNSINIQFKILIFIFILSMAPFNFFLYKIILTGIDRIYQHCRKGE